jgi:chemosensory pili system protein ChpB (putative protein-glutamate methylesterase)
MAVAGISIGIIADSSLQRHLLQSAIKNYGYNIAINTDAHKFDKTSKFDVAVWIIDLADDDSELLDHILSEDIPVLVGIESAPNKGDPDHPRWEKRLYSKLQDLVGHIELPEDDESSLKEIQASINKTSERLSLPVELKGGASTYPAKNICVLGASLGGPAAVKEFLDMLPEGLPITFIYAQHIDANFQTVLTQVLGRHCAFQFEMCKQDTHFSHGKVYMVPADNEMRFTASGRVDMKSNPWPGPYGPSVDHLMLNVANHFGTEVHHIVFSGMGNDGAEAAVQLKSRGNIIWTQQAESCASASMPESVRETGCSTYTANPKQLAIQLVNHMRLQAVAFSNA